MIAPPATFRTELNAMLRLAAPLAAANLLQMAVYALDVMFNARLGEEALAASSLAVTIFSLLAWCFTGLSGAVAPLIAAELGRKRHAVREVRRSMRMGLWLALVLGLAGVAVCSYGREILLLTGQSPRIAARAQEFLGILKWAMVPMVLCNVMRIFVATMGRPGLAMVITAQAIVVNFFGNYALVFGHFGAPAMGLRGSATASIITVTITLLLYAVVIRLDRRLRRYRLMGRWWRPDWERLGQLISLGVPIALTVVAEGGLFSSAALLMGLIGEAHLAGHTVALQVAALAFQVPMGIGQAATIRVGYHYGAGDRLAIGRAGWAAMLIGVGFSLASALPMVFSPRLILSAYIDIDAPANAVMIGFAVQYMVIAAAFQLFDGAQAIAAGALRGLQDTRVPMVLALAGYWPIGFGTAVWLGFRTPLSGLGVWLGLAIGLVVVAGLLVWRWNAREKLGVLQVPFSESPGLAPG